MKNLLKFKILFLILEMFKTFASPKLLIPIKLSALVQYTIRILKLDLNSVKSY